MFLRSVVLSLLIGSLVAVLWSHLDQTGQDPACGSAAAHLARGACSCEKKKREREGLSFKPVGEHGETYHV